MFGVGHDLLEEVVRVGGRGVDVAAARVLVGHQRRGGGHIGGGIIRSPRPRRGRRRGVLVVRHGLDFGDFFEEVNLFARLFVSNFRCFLAVQMVGASKNGTITISIQGSIYPDTQKRKTEFMNHVLF